MGYACPVCEVPQADAEHLANHLAFTALLGDAAHESWLDEHAPDWGGLGPEELGAAVAEYAPEAEDPRVFEDTTPEDHPAGGPVDAGAVPPGDLDEEAAAVLREARELTERMRDGKEE